MTDEPIFMVEKLLDFLYRGTYTEVIARSPEDEEKRETIFRLQLHAKMFALGDKYCIPELCQAALAKYSQITGYDSPESIIDPLDYLASIPDVFFSAGIKDTTLKDYALGLAKNRLARHLSDKSVRTFYDSVVTQVPEFTIKLLDKYLTIPESIYVNRVYYYSQEDEEYPTSYGDYSEGDEDDSDECLRPR